MAETVFKRASRKGYTVVLRSAAQDSRLSLKARGLFLLMQSFPDDWSYTQYGLAKIAGVGRDQIRSALKELENTGYLKAEQSHDEAGKFGGAVYVLLDEAPDTLENLPETDVPPTPADTADGAAEAETAGSPPLLGNPMTGNPPLLENPTTAENPPLSEKPMTGKPAAGKPMTGKPAAGNPTLQNNKINNNNKHTPPTPHRGGACAPKWEPGLFEKFWTFYRNHAHAVGARAGSRAAAARAWDRLKPEAGTRQDISAGLRRLFGGEMQRRGYGIPHAATWLNQRRYLDDEDGEDGGPGGSGVPGGMDTTVRGYAL